MTSTFVPKTIPKVLHSGPGAGRADGFFPRNKPKPGIKARDFRVEVARRIKPRYAAAMASAVRRAANHLFTGPKVRGRIVTGV